MYSVQAAVRIKKQNKGLLENVNFISKKGVTFKEK